MSSLLIAQKFYDLSEKYEFYTSIIIMFNGLCSNIFIILILTGLRIFRGNQCAFYLIIECISNIGLLSVILSSRILTYILHKDPVHLSIIWCKIRTWSTQVFCFISLVTICCATFDQYLSTNYRYSIRKISTIKLAYRLTFIIICFGTLHNIPLLILSEINSILGCTVNNIILRKYYSCFYYPILSSTLPLIVTISFSLLAYRNVRRIVRRQIPLVRRRLDHQMTAMILARVICLIILGLPYIIFLLFDLNIHIDENNYIALSMKRLIEAFILSLFYANYSINLYIYCTISSHFRHQIRHFLRKKFCHHKRLSRPHGNHITPKNFQQPISIIDLD